MSDGSRNSENFKQENERQYESIDQMLSMHSSLSGMYERRSFWLNTAQITISLLLCVLAFVGDDVLRSLGYHPPMARFIFGFSAVIVLILSITEFRVDWKSTGSRHVEAVKYLAKLKAKYRKAFNESSGNDPQKNAKLMTEYQKTMAGLPPIPDRLFIQLKAGHQFKRIISRRLTQNPKAPKWFLQAQLRLEGICDALKKEKENGVRADRETRIN